MTSFIASLPAAEEPDDQERRDRRKLLADAASVARRTEKAAKRLEQLKRASGFYHERLVGIREKAK